MSFFHRKKRGVAMLLIDIGADSVAGAYTQYIDGEQPVVHYTKRTPIEIRGKEPHADAMLRALKALGDTLIHKGAHTFLRATGSAAIDTILVSIDAPWQTTSIRTENLEQDEPFVFTKGMVSAVLKKTRTTPEKQLLADESIIGTILNGYETHAPYGKHARRASIIILTSLIDEEVAREIHTLLRGLCHTKETLSIAGSSLRYQALRIAFPHERDALILDATGPLTSIALVRRDLLVDVIEVPTKVSDAMGWLKETATALAALAKRFPLPRTIFLLAREPDAAPLKDTLDKGDLGSLWLSDNPPKIVAVLGSHIMSFIRQTASTPPDLSLLLMALYAEKRIFREEVVVDKSTSE